MVLLFKEQVSIIDICLVFCLCPLISDHKFSTIFVVNHFEQNSFPYIYFHFIYFGFHVYGYFACVHIYIQCTCLVMEEARGGHWITWT